MSNILQKSLVLLLCLSLALATQCPIDNEVSRFTQLTGDTHTKISEFYDAFYEIKLSSVGSSYSLNGYKITEVDNLANTGFETEQFSTVAGAAWKILAVSQLGNCIVIDNRPNLIAFDTSAKSFVSAQNITEANFVSGQVNDDCSIVRLTLEDGTQKVFIDDTENTQIVFPANSLFDSYFTYGIDTTGSLKKVSVSDSQLRTVILQASALKNTPVSVMNRKDLNSLILVTSNVEKTEYTVTVVNTLDDSKAYSRTWTSTSFTGEFKAELSTEGSFALLRDDSGFVMLLQITYSETATPPLLVSEIQLEKDEYLPLFGADSVISLTQNAVVVYLNGKLTYFQAHKKTLYYLAQIVEDLELEAIKYANESSPDIAFTSTYFFSDQLESCDAIPSDGGDTDGGDTDGGDTDGGDTDGGDTDGGNTDGGDTDGGDTDGGNTDGGNTDGGDTDGGDTDGGDTDGGDTDGGIDESELEEEDEEPVLDRNGNAIMCAPECVTCTAQGVCRVCSLGYSLTVGGQCVLCEGCKSCLEKQPSKCTSCFKPEVLNPVTKACEQPTCEDICIDCSIEGKCLECEEGYSPFQGRCVQCQNGCSSCKKNGKDTCDQEVKSCKQGFVFFPTPSRSVKFSCVECATGCLGCSASDLSSCTSCNEGYYISIDSDTKKPACFTCVENCQTCANKQSCTKCATGFRLSDDKTRCVQRCDDSCLTCSETIVTECKSCYLGSKLAGTQCVADLSCNVGKTCTSCSLGFALRFGECIQCTTGDANCIACSPSNVNSCTRCASGFYINGNRQCIKCSSECKTCQNQDACMSCSDGFYLDRVLLSATGRCLACRSRCKTCTRNAFFCTTCREGFSLEGTKCIDENRVDYEATASSGVSQVAVFARTFIQIMIDAARQASIDSSKPLELTTDDVTLKRITPGSAILEGEMSTGNAAQSNALSSKLASYLEGRELESGFTILSTKVTAVIPKTVVNEEASQSTSLGLILGIAIPLTIITLVVIGIILIIYKLKKRKEDQDSDKYSSNSGVFANESQKYMQKYSEQSDKV